MTPEELRALGKQAEIEGGCVGYELEALFEALADEIEMQIGK